MMLELMIGCQEAQRNLLLNKYQRFIFKPNVCRCIEKMLWSSQTEETVLQYSLEISFQIARDLNLRVLEKKRKVKLLNYLAKKKKTTIFPHK